MAITVAIDTAWKAQKVYLGPDIYRRCIEFMIDATEVESIVA